MPADSDARRELAAALLVFVLTSAFLWWLAACRLVLTLDEGIYLDGALRILKGQAPYRDFFAITGPGSFWVHALLFQVFGVGLAQARLTVIVDFAVMSAAVFWLTRRLAGPAMAVFGTLCFLAFGASDPASVIPNHRWDAGAAALVAICLSCALDRHRSRAAAVLAGISAAAAAWFTPSMATLLALLAAWLLANRDLRWALPWYLSACAAVSSLGAGWLAWQGALMPMLEHMRWAAANYAEPNRVPYGAAVGGYSRLFAGCDAAEFAIRIPIVLCVALPALLPLANMGGLALLWRRRRDGPPRREVALLLASTAALIASTYPRWDLTHLLHVSAVSYVLAGVLLARGLKRTPRNAVCVTFLLFAALFLFSAVQGRLAAVSASSRVGKVVASPQDIDLVRWLERHIPRGGRLFVFPYMPLFYFLTRAENPTRYCFLQPGMMTADDEAAALTGLATRPPDHVIYSGIRPRAYLHLFPSSNPARLRMNALEEFLGSRYQPQAELAHPSGTYRILGRKPIAEPLAWLR